MPPLLRLREVSPSSCSPLHFATFLFPDKTRQAPVQQDIKRAGCRRASASMHRFLVPAFLSLLAVQAADAKDLKILTGAGMSMPVKALATAFGQRTGTQVMVVSDTAGGVQKRIEAGEAFD